MTALRGIAAPRTTRAAVWHGGEALSVETVEVPHLQPGEALVRVILATVCGSDRHTVSGRRPAPCPSVLGHEAVGEIVAVGDGPAPLTVDGLPMMPGQRVVWSVTLGCGRCDLCTTGLTAKCRSLRKTGHEPFDSAWRLSGGYAEHVLLPAGLAVVAVPDALPDAVATPAACATATSVAVVDRAGSLAGRRVLIIGAGMLGLVGCALAARAGAVSVTAVDLAPARRELARNFGADSVVASADEVGKRVDVVLDFSGAPSAISAAFNLLDVRGVAVLAGSVMPAQPVALDAEQVVRRHLTVRGVHNYEPRHLQQAVDFLVATHPALPWSELVGEPVGLSRLGELLFGEAGRLPRYAVRP